METSRAAVSMAKRKVLGEAVADDSQMLTSS